MYNSIDFKIDNGNSAAVEKNTFDDWHIVPSSRPLINPPEPKTRMVEIPGRDGALDLSEALLGRIFYNNSVGEWEFIVLNSSFTDHNLTYKDWNQVYHDILGALNGKRGSCVLESDPGKEYFGRFSVNSWRSDKDYSKVTIGYELSPRVREFLGIKIAQEPKTHYKEWETFDPSQLIINSQYEESDGTIKSTQLSASEYEIEVDSPLRSTTKKAVVKHSGLGKNTSLDIALEVLKLHYITVTTPPNKTTYREGETFTPIGMVVSKYFGQNVYEAESNYKYTVDSPLIKGIDRVDIRYTIYNNNYDTFLPIRVLYVIGIMVSKNPDVIKYFEGSEFNGAGMEVSKIYDDQSNVLIDFGVDIKAPSELTRDNKTVLLSWYDPYRKTYFNTSMDVIIAYMLSISVQTPPIKTVYREGELLDISGLSILGSYTENMSRLVSSYSISIGAHDKDPSIPLEYLLDTSFTIKHEEYGKEFLTNQSITVKAFPGKVWDVVRVSDKSNFVSIRKLNGLWYGCDPAKHIYTSIDGREWTFSNGDDLCSYIDYSEVATKWKYVAVQSVKGTGFLPIAYAIKVSEDGKKWEQADNSDLAGHAYTSIDHVVIPEYGIHKVDQLLWLASWYLSDGSGRSGVDVSMDGLTWETFQWSGLGTSTKINQLVHFKDIFVLATEEGILWTSKFGYFERGISRRLCGIATAVEIVKTESLEFPEALVALTTKGIYTSYDGKAWDLRYALRSDLGEKPIYRGISYNGSDIVINVGSRLLKFDYSSGTVSELYNGTVILFRFFDKLPIAAVSYDQTHNVIKWYDGSEWQSINTLPSFTDYGIICMEYDPVDEIGILTGDTTVYRTD